MPRPIILSNNSMLVGINRYGLVHDVYFPYVGLEDHNTAKTLRHLIGVWVEGQFCWMDDDSWEVQFTYEPGVLVSHITATQPELGVKLDFHDSVDPYQNVLVRRITVYNLADRPRELRLMLHQVFLISNSLNGDTAQYLPHESAILHYKGHRSFIIKATTASGEPFDQHSIGLCGIEGREGTFRDAEDGELDGSSVEHGRVDSVMRLRLDIPAQGSEVVDYWVSAGRTRQEAIITSHAVVPSEYDRRLAATRSYWKTWSERAEKAIPNASPDRRRRFEQGLLLIKAHTDRDGSIIASSDTQMLNYARDAYAYCWPRDAYYALKPLIRLGYTEEAKAFFTFCEHAKQLGGYLMHKYQADASIGSSWHPYIHNGQPELPIQEDETACVVLLIDYYHQCTGDTRYLKQLYPKLVKPMTDWLAHYFDKKTGLPHASYDLWEQKFLTTTYTTAVVYAALRSGARLAEVVGQLGDAVFWQTTADEIEHNAHQQLFNYDTKYFYKGLLATEPTTQYDPTVDVSSWFGAWHFGLYAADDPQVQIALDTLLKRLAPAERFAGLGRYEQDTYNNAHPGSVGNPWFITSLWLAQHYIAAGQLERAEEIVTWVERLMMPTGVLSEQVDPHDGSQVSVAPLVWSQAEYLTTLMDLEEAHHGAKPKSRRVRPHRVSVARTHKLVRRVSA